MSFVAQVTLNLDVERILPDFVRRRFIVRQETVLPNQSKSIFAKVFQDDNTLKRIAHTVVAKGNEVSAVGRTSLNTST